MAESFISAVAKGTAARIDPDQFKTDPNSEKLDLVINSQSGKSGSSQGSVQKIARFQPNQLKAFSQDIHASLTSRKQAASVRIAESALVKNKVESIRAQNPFANQNALESNSGRKVNISA